MHEGKQTKRDRDRDRDRDRGKKESVGVSWIKSAYLNGGLLVLCKDLPNISKYKASLSHTAWYETRDRKKRERLEKQSMEEARLALGVCVGVFVVFLLS